MDIDPYFDSHARTWNKSFVGTLHPLHRQPRSVPLPEEILEHIVNNLALPSANDQDFENFDMNDIKEITHTLFSLSLASTALNRVAEKVLYKTCFALPYPKAFVSALYARPNRIRFVKELVVPPISSTLFSAHPYNISANLRMLDTDHAISVLLRLCTSLEVLDVTICKEFPGSRTESTMDDLGSDDYAGPLLNNLKRVVFRSCAVGCKRAPDMRLLYKFPNVEEKVFHGLDLAAAFSSVRERNGGYFGDYVLQQSGQSLLKSLHLSQCRLETGQDLGLLLSTWPALTSLNLTCIPGILDCRDVSKVLIQCCPQLERLHFDTRELHAGGYMSNDRQEETALDHNSAFESLYGALGSLRELRNLEYLAISPKDLLGKDFSDDASHMPGESTVETLPARLQHLVIVRHAGAFPKRGDYPRMKSTDDHLVQVVLCSERVKRVKRVEVRES
jgi:hypothetical protein